MMHALGELERIQSTFGPGIAPRKRALIGALARSRLPTARAIVRFHEALLFLSAFPDDRAILSVVRAALDGFGRRPDVARHRNALAGTGIAGTVIRFPFFWFTARWLARRWPDRLAIDWQGWEKKGGLEDRLPHLLPYCETLTLDQLTYPPREWLRRLKGTGESDASFLIRRFDGLDAGSFGRESAYNELAIPLVLAPGPTTPARSRARWPRVRVAYVTRPLSTGRPDLLREALRAPRSVRAVPRAEATRLIDLARVSMATRERDLDAFEKADPRDVRWIDSGGGLAFACFGVVPSRRLMLESVYGFLTLKNGVPIGYVLASALFGSSEVAYNVFETWRGAESAQVYGRVLGMLHHLFGSTTFSIDPYQLGHDNEEGQQSGAWWFYHKLGFRPVAPRVLRLMKRELGRIRRDAAYRSSPATVHRLAAASMFLHLGRPRRDVLGAIGIENVGLALSRFLADGWGADRERALEDCAREARRLLGVTSLAGWSREERRWCRRWSPLICALPGLARWTAAERRALVTVLRAKAGPRESDFVALFDRHAKLRRAILRLAARDPGVKPDSRRLRPAP